MSYIQCWLSLFICCITFPSKMQKNEIEIKLCRWRKLAGKSGRGRTQTSKTQNDELFFYLDFSISYYLRIPCTKLNFEKMVVCLFLRVRFGLTLILLFCRCWTNWPSLFRAGQVIAVHLNLCLILLRGQVVERSMSFTPSPRGPRFESRCHQIFSSFPLSLLEWR